MALRATTRRHTLCLQSLGSAGWARESRELLIGSGNLAPVNVEPLNEAELNALDAHMAATESAMSLAEARGYLTAVIFMAPLHLVPGCKRVRHRLLHRLDRCEVCDDITNNSSLRRRERSDPAFKLQLRPRVVATRELPRELKRQIVESLPLVEQVP
jgi:hypothetical protein